MGTVAGEGATDDGVGVARVAERVGGTVARGETLVQPSHHVDRGERVGDWDRRRDDRPRSHREQRMARTHEPQEVPAGREGLAAELHRPRRARARSIGK